MLHRTFREQTNLSVGCWRFSFLLQLNSCLHCSHQQRVMLRARGGNVQPAQRQQYAGTSVHDRPELISTLAVGRIGWFVFVFVFVVVCVVNRPCRRSEHAVRGQHQHAAVCCLSANSGARAGMRQVCGETPALYCGPWHRPRLCQPALVRWR